VTNPAKAIRIGTMIQASAGKGAENIAAIADLGFESFEPFFWQTTNGQDLAELGKRSLDAIGNRDITINTIGMFGNPLEDQEMDRQTLQGWKDCIDNAHHFGATTVAGFTGRVRNKPLTDSLPRYREVWSRRQGRQDRLRELRHGWQLGDRRLEHRAQSRRLAADVQRNAGRQYRA
jgi:sugar phosphate isomerase/epimerase